jgi:hypothetical protein
MARCTDITIIECGFYLALYMHTELANIVMHTELANIVIHLESDLIYKSYDFQNEIFIFLV